MHQSPARSDQPANAEQPAAAPADQPKQDLGK
jgi:hypothetical protein